MGLIVDISLNMLLIVVAWIVLGVIIGILSAMLGVGGGTIMVPLFRLVGGFSPVASAATSLFVIVPTGVSGVYNHLRAGTCNLRVGLAAGIAGACTSVLGARLADVAPGWVVMIAAACVIAFSAYTMLRKALKSPAKGSAKGSAKATAKGSAPASDAAPATAVATATATTDAASASAPVATTAPSPEAAPISTGKLVLAAAIGLAAGLLSGFVGVGGGFIMVPLFTALLGMDMHHAAGTSLVTVFCVALPAAIAHLVMGNVLVVPGISVALGSIVGTFAGQRLAMRMSDRALRLAFGALLLVAAILLVVKELSVL